MAEAAVDTLGHQLRSEFNDNAGLRKPFEKRWLKDLRQYGGIYEPEVMERLKKDATRSRVFLRKTKTKVDSITARLIDLLFPAKGERNWDIAPSTTPEVHPILLHEAWGMEAARLGRKLTPEEQRSILLSMAGDAATGMGKEMEGQLAEGPGRPSYRSICERVLFQGSLYGCGVIKGPLVERRRREKFAYSDESGWTLGMDEGEYWPYREFVSIWDVFPDLTATDPSGLRFVWQSHLKTLKELRELETWPGFSAEAIRAHIADNPDGDAELADYEAQVRGISAEELAKTSAGVPGRYRLLERWGYLSGKQLKEAGVDVQDEAGAYPANVWLLGNRVLKAVLAPIEGVDIPYSFFFYSDDETAFFPEGVASIMRHPQNAFNSAIRMALDNAAICAGPQFAVNMSALHESVKPNEIYPRKVWKFKNVEDLKQAMQVFNIDSNVNDLMAVAKLMADWSDEVTTPRFMSGDNAMGGAAETARGLSMLMGAANIVLKGLVSRFDNTITRPFIGNLYYWNMRFNPRDEIKGDFIIKATGSSALIARELQAEQMVKVIQMTENPRFRPYAKDRDILTEAFKLMDVNVPLRTEEEVQEEMRKEMAARLLEEARANVEALLGVAKQEGVPLPDAIVRMLDSEMQRLGMAQ